MVGVEEALEREWLDRGGHVDVDVDGVKFFDLKSGESLVLE